MGKKQRLQPIQRVFVSSTFEDMEKYRSAAMDALMSIEQMPVGMENFIASNDNSLEACLTDVRRCQMLILIIGMRYGSEDNNTGKSYTELEFEEAERNNIPVLAFLVNEKECPVLPIYVDTGGKAEKLREFKSRLKEEKYCAMFSSEEDLKNLIIRSVGDYFDDQQYRDLSEMKQNEMDMTFKEGAELYRRFLFLPERMKNTTALLRLRMDGLFANTFLRRDEFYEAYNVKKGDTIIAENVIPIGVASNDIERDAAYMDMYAEGSAADWIIDNKITTGVVFEGKFRFAYEVVKGVASNGAVKGPFDSKVPALILLEGLSITGASEETMYTLKPSKSEDPMTLL